MAVQGDLIYYYKYEFGSICYFYLCSGKRKRAQQKWTAAEKAEVRKLFSSDILLERMPTKKKLRTRNRKQQLLLELGVQYANISDFIINLREHIQCLNSSKLGIIWGRRRNWRGNQGKDGVF